MIPMHKKATHWGVSTNQEDWEVNPDLDSNLDQAVEMVLDLEMDQAPFDNTYSFWIGRAYQYNAAYFVEKALTEWDFLEERAQERFYDESMCENDDAFKFPQGQERVEWFRWLETLAEQMCNHFDIKINYYEIKDPEEHKMRIWMLEGDDEPRYEFMIRNQRYGSHPLEKSAPQRDNH